MLSDKYPRLYEIFGAYFNEDFDIWGDSIEEIVACYKRDSQRKCHIEMIREIDCFVEEHSGDLDSAFNREYGRDFNPLLWGYTVASFFDELKRLLSE
jgi:hypothetical protein